MALSTFVACARILLLHFANSIKTAKSHQNANAKKDMKMYDLFDISECRELAR